MTTTISAICPVVRSDFNRFELLLTSLNHFALEPYFDEFWCSIPKSDIFEFSNYFSEFKVEKFCKSKLKIISDDDLIPPEQIKTGWHKQQLIKLLISSKLKSDFYCVFDSDVLCCTPVMKTSFIDNYGRALMQYDGHNGQNVWMKNTCRVLNTIPSSNLKYMDVTPAILSTKIVQDICQKYELKTLVRWIGSEMVSEYSLYYITCVSQDLLEKYHFIGRIITDTTIWYLPEVFSWTFEKAMEEKIPFTLYQSNVKISDLCVSAHVRKILFPHIKLPEINCICVLNSNNLDLDCFKASLGSFLFQTYENSKLYILDKNKILNNFPIYHPRIHICQDLSKLDHIELVAEWNCNTIYHSTRLEVQYRILNQDTSYFKCYFGQQLIFSKNTSIVKISPKSSIGLSPMYRNWSLSSHMENLNLNNSNPKTSFCIEKGLHILSIYIFDLTTIQDQYINSIKGQTWELYQYHPLYSEEKRNEMNDKIKELYLKSLKTYTHVTEDS